MEALRQFSRFRAVWEPPSTLSAHFQAKAEDVTNIVTGDTRSGSYTAYLIRSGSAIGVFIFRRTLIRHDLLVCGILVGRNALSKSTLRFVQADPALREKLKGVRRDLKPFCRTFEGGFHKPTID